MFLNFHSHNGQSPEIPDIAKDFRDFLFICAYWMLRGFGRYLLLCWQDCRHNNPSLNV